MFFYTFLQPSCHFQLVSTAEGQHEMLYSFFQHSGNRAPKSLITAWFFFNIQIFNHKAAKPHTRALCWPFYLSLARRINAKQIFAISGSLINHSGQQMEKS